MHFKSSLMIPLIVILTAHNFHHITSEILVERYKMRAVRNHDIGLLFDVQIMNTIKEDIMGALVFRIDSDRCCLQLDANEPVCNMGFLIGGQLGTLLPGKRTTVTLIYPTLTLHNRIGFCDITVTAKATGEPEIRIYDKIKFNTSITAEFCPETMTDILIGVTFRQCLTDDMNPFDDCNPINCEEKYFGQRNYFNPKFNVCQPVPICAARNTVIYDSVTNECTNWNNVFNAEHLKRMRNGEFNDFVWKMDDYLNQFHYQNGSEIDLWNIPIITLPEKTKSMSEKQKNFGVLNYGVVIVLLCIIVYVLISIIVILFLVFILKLK